jgi:hypothetical protein
MEQVESLLNRPKFYQNVDGVYELALGFMMMGFQALIWLQGHSSAQSIWNRMYTLFIFVGLMILAVNFGTKSIKNRITYRRTGFVKYQKPKALPIILISLSSFAISATMVFALFHLSRWRADSIEPFSLIFGLFLTACYAYGIARAVRWKWIVVSGMTVSAVVVALLPAQVLDSLAPHSNVAVLFSPKLMGAYRAYLLYCFIWSSLTLVSGGISFFLYLRSAPALPESE